MRRLLAPAAALLLVAGAAPAADPVDLAEFDKQVRAALADVHNRGADLHNQAKDYGGAYRLYEGGLRAVRPLLGHRPAMQKRIDDDLAAAEKEPDASRKVYLLHVTIEAVRAELKGPMPAAEKAEAKPDPKTVAVKKDPPAPTPKPKDPPAAPPAAGAADLAGTVTLKGQPVPGAEVTFVSLDLKEPKVTTVKTTDDGAFAAKGLPPGKYVVTVTLVQDGKSVLPAKYATTDTSGLTAEVKAAGGALNLELK